jgi:cyclic-di-GMP phosphodiesterase, flagellum assembly factor TipF
MPGWMAHGLLAALYGGAAILVAVAVPLIDPGLSPLISSLFGLIILVIGLGIHQTWRQGRDDAARERRLGTLEAQQADLARSLRETMQEALRAIQTPAAAPMGGTGAFGAVVSEARVLERLAGQWTQAARPPEDDEPAAFGDEVRSRMAPPRPLFSTQPVMRAGRTQQEAALILERVRTALRTDHVDIFLQPIVSLPQRKHRYYELFSRIRSVAETGGQVRYMLPDEYLDVAEAAGLMAPIDNLLLFRGIQLLRETEKRHQNVGFFCNISAATLDDAGFMGEFVQYMGQNPNLANKLVFELAQKDLMRGGLFTASFLDGLRRLGFRFSMDQVDDLELDWAAMAAHEIRYVKLDAARLLDPAGPFADPRSMMELRGHLNRHNIDLIVEKIETEAQLIELLDLYIDFGQGYLFGEPRLARKQG